MASKSKKKPLLSGHVSRIRKIARDEGPKAGLEAAKHTVQTEALLRRYGSIDAVETTSKRRYPRSRVQSLDAEFTGSYDRDKMIATCRDLEVNFSLFRGLVDIHVLNVVGTGPKLQVRTEDAEWNDRKESWFADWSGNPRRCDVRGIHTFGDIIKLAERRQIVDGDIGFIQAKDVKLQGIEADRINNPPRKNRKDGKHYVFGVETDRVGKPLAYHVWRRGSTRKGSNYIGRIAERNFIHYFDAERFDQTRGISRMIASVNDNQDMRETLEAVKGTMKLENVLGVGVVSKAVESLNDNSSFFGQTTQYDATNCDGSVSQRQEYSVEQGVNIWEMAEGEDIKMFQKQTPGNQFEPFMMFQIRLAGLALRMPLELGLQYYSRGSFSSIKGAIGQYHHSVNEDRKRLENHILNRVQRWVTRAGIRLYQVTNGERGLEPPADMSLVDAYEWQWDALPILEPEKAIGADVEEYKARVTTLKDMAVKRNRDWETIARQQAREIKQLRVIAEEEGLETTALDPMVIVPGQQQTTAEPPTNDEGSDDE